MVNGILAVVIGYLLGSIPSAYLITRALKGKDIRTPGGGNVGARNVFREVGKAAGFAVGIFDVVKGTAAILIAYRLLDVPLLQPHSWVLAAGFAAIVGHVWSIYLKFTGGNGLATTLGVLVLVMPQGLLIVLAITVVLIPITRNPILSVNIGLLSTPLSAWLILKSGALVIFTIVTLTVLAVHFMRRVGGTKLIGEAKQSFSSRLGRKKG